MVHVNILEMTKTRSLMKVFHTGTNPAPSTYNSSYAHTQGKFQPQREKRQTSAFLHTQRLLTIPK